MQDGASISGEDASRWLREHFAGQAEPDITFTWAADAAPDQGAYERLLEILFKPRSDDLAA
ncbi:hypothetical protein ACGF5F_29455 [Streptomyces sp. NPDC047821]|uniref:hypothetical protein n=1 Tax=Streptomyces sp. NPDC047821 TaxID=3365488 RepID=UPI003724198C